MTHSAVILSLSVTVLVRFWVAYKKFLFQLPSQQQECLCRFKYQGRRQHLHSPLLMCHELHFKVFQACKRAKVLKGNAVFLAALIVNNFQLCETGAIVQCPDRSRCHLQYQVNIISQNPTS